MDAKIGDWVVTPRQGKPVEINALWYNALRILADLSKRFKQDADALEYDKRARQVKKGFMTLFWNARQQCLYDYINKDYRETAIRPNQIFALSLPFPLLSKKYAESVLRIIEKRLLTPFGLQTLDPRHSDFAPRYEGDQLARDSAYHQGTVWGWLLGPYITAIVRYRGADGKHKARAIIKNLKSHLTDAGIGSISEIFDAKTPHKPRGCIAQAWSVAEILRAYMEDVLG
jgi:predicted glycogen debranching enzyme